MTEYLSNKYRSLSITGISSRTRHSSIVGVSNSVESVRNNISRRNSSCNGKIKTVAGSSRSSLKIGSSSSRINRNSNDRKLGPGKIDGSTASIPRSSTVAKVPKPTASSGLRNNFTLLEHKSISQGSSQSSNTYAPAGFAGQYVEISSPHAKEGVVKGYLFSPPETNQKTLAGLVLLCPGSGGGVGPGLTVHPQPFSNTPIAHGGMYPRLGKELSMGMACKQWEDALESKKEVPSKSTQKSASQKGKEKGGAWNIDIACVTLQIDWSTIPRKRLRRKDMLESSVADIAAAGSWLVSRYPGVPLVLAGFSFGGPSVWPAAARLSSAPIAGVAALAGSARGGGRYVKSELSTWESVKAFSARRIEDKRELGTSAAHSPAVLFLHGTHDKNVALEVAEHLFQAATQPRSLVQVNHAKHMFDSTRDIAYSVFREWVIGAIIRWHTLNSSLACNDKTIENKYFDTMVQLGRPLPALRPGSRLGQEVWRQKRSKKRLEKYCNDENHPLAGMIGYSE